MEAHRYVRVVCALTGVEFSLSDAHVLNVQETERRLAQRRQELAYLEQLAAKLGSSATPDGKPAHHRPLIAPAVAHAMDSGVTEGLLVPLAQQREQNALAFFERMRVHSFYGPRIAGVPKPEIPAVMALGRRLLQLVDPERKLSRDAKTALGVGVAAALRGKIIEECELILVTHAANGTLAQLGVAPDVCDELGPAIIRALGQSQHVPEEDE